MELWYKKERQWVSIQTTPFAVLEYKDLDVYISEYNAFYLGQVGNGTSLIDAVFSEAKEYLQVCQTLRGYIRYADQFPGPVAMGHAEIMDCTSSANEGLGSERASDPWDAQSDRRRVVTLWHNSSSSSASKSARQRSRTIYCQAGGGMFERTSILYAQREEETMGCGISSGASHATYKRERHLEAAILDTKPESSKYQNRPQAITYRSQAYKWRHPEMPTTLIRSSVHVSNILLSHLYFAGEVPREFYNIEARLKSLQLDSASARYDWMNESSLDFSLCSFAFDSNDQKLPRQAKPQAFGC